MVIRLLGAAAALCVLVATPSQAQLNPQQTARAISMLESADADGDGFTTRREFAVARGAAFSRFDRNGDGVLSAADAGQRGLRRARNSSRLESLRAAFDANRDGAVSQLEFINGPAPMFDRADVNADNRVSRAELNALR